MLALSASGAAFDRERWGIQAAMRALYKGAHDLPGIRTRAVSASYIVIKMLLCVCARHLIKVQPCTLSQTHAHIDIDTRTRTRSRPHGDTDTLGAHALTLAQLANLLS